MHPTPNLSRCALSLGVFQRHRLAILPGTLTTVYNPTPVGPPLPTFPPAQLPPPRYTSSAPVYFPTHPRRGLTTLSPVEVGKRAAAFEAVNAHFGHCPRYVGIGSGSTVPYVIERIKELPEDRLCGSRFIPTSWQSTMLIRNAGLTLASLDDVQGGIDVGFDGADEVDEWLNCVKGGGACLLQEKIVAVNACSFVVVADRSKLSPTLLSSYRRGVPVEVIPNASPFVLRRLRALGSENPSIRSGSPAKAGPCVTDHGNFIIDAPFDPLESNSAVEELAVRLKAIVGVVGHGLFWKGDRRPTSAYFGLQESVEVRHRN